MIVELTVENLAIIERSQLVLGPGFTALTGETGAGKSLLIDAIELALGERADSELVRAGTPRASVSVVFDLSGSPELVHFVAAVPKHAERNRAAGCRDGERGAHGRDARDPGGHVRSARVRRRHFY